MITNPVIPSIVLLPVCILIFAAFAVGILRKNINISSKVMRLLRVLLILTFVFLINLRIMGKRYNVDIEMKNIDVLFVVDTTISMWAEDYDGGQKRMDAAIRDCNYIMNELSGSNFALIRFDNRSQTLAPFTQDARNVADAFTTIKTPDRYYARGTTLNTPYEDMAALLSSSAKKEGRLTVLFFISDGEITDDSALMSFAPLEPLVNGGAVLGYGTKEGGKMYDKNSYGYLKDPETNEDAISVYDEDTLTQLSQDLDIDYIHMEKQNNIEYLLDSIKNGSSMEIASSDDVSYEDTYYFYAIPLLMLLILELVLIIRRGRI